MLQNLFSSTRITFNPQIVETNELKKTYYCFGRDDFFYHTLLMPFLCYIFWSHFNFKRFHIDYDIR